MPTQLQLEGPDLETLLARVRAEHGAAARIVRAEKVRTGGVGGFFAKQHYEINVEVEDAPAPPAAPSARRPTSILELADEVSDREHTTAAVSTESTGFAAVLARLGATAGDEPAAAAPPTRRAPAASPPAAAADAGAGAPLVPAQRQSPPCETPAAQPIRSRVVAARPAAGATTVRSRSAAVATRPVHAVAVPARPAAATRSAAATRPAAVADLRPDERLTARLSELGLPAHLHPTSRPDAVRQLQSALVDSLRRLPKAPRPVSRPGGVLAVVGPAAQALDVAHQMARELDLPARSAVVLATPATAGQRSLPQLSTAEEARRRRTSWNRRRHTTIVVVDTPVTALAAAQARAFLDGLEPTATWAVVEATRKPRDVGAWTRAVGGVDALALVGADETADPASVLELEIPVGRLGTRRATPALWASLLADRVAA